MDHPNHRHRKTVFQRFGVNFQRFGVKKPKASEIGQKMSDIPAEILRTFSPRHRAELEADPEMRRVLLLGLAHMKCYLEIQRRIEQQPEKTQT